MSEAFPPSDGCLAMLVSVTISALVLSAAMFTPADVPSFYFAVLLVVAVVVGAIAIPQYLLVLHSGRQSIWTAIAVGAITGAILPLTVALSGMARAWATTFAFALVGAIGGVIFYLTATVARNPARKIAIVLTLTGVSVTLAPIVGAWLSPAPS
ncbi:MAG: hypothetical protein KF730_11035 [Sphingomonas sp.]|uniref:hypothetical protein n=1 Tax=Sphingomonas sp. TaxID=28214 RepID=UPI00260109AB|nr:hypothetical protein [Sphingomonas sp.]MBX3565094.1 hypothetical protein [Sphingomonas sp.]